MLAICAFAALLNLGKSAPEILVRTEVGDRQWTVGQEILEHSKYIAARGDSLYILCQATSEGLLYIISGDKSTKFIPTDGEGLVSGPVSIRDKIYVAVYRKAEQRYHLISLDERKTFLSAASLLEMDEKLGRQRRDRFLSIIRRAEFYPPPPIGVSLASPEGLYETFIVNLPAVRDTRWTFNDELEKGIFLWDNMTAMAVSAGWDSKSKWMRADLSSLLSEGLPKMGYHLAVSLTMGKDQTRIAATNYHGEALTVVLEGDKIKEVLRDELTVARVPVLGD